MFTTRTGIRNSNFNTLSGEPGAGRLCPSASPSFPRFLKPVLLGFLLFLLALPQLGAQSWLDGYCYRKAITIDGVPGTLSTDLTNFPVLIDITDADLADTTNGGYVTSPDGWDIAFSADEVTPLDLEIETYDPILGRYLAWVKVPTVLQNGTTVIYIYFGSVTPGANPSTEDAWSENYTSIYHLGQTFEDATGINADGTAIGIGTNYTSKIFEGSRFNSAGDYISIETNGLSAASGTIETWVWNISGGYIFGHSDQTTWAQRIQLYTNSNQPLDLGLGNSHTTAQNIYNLGASWNHIALTWDGVNYQVFVNGTLRRSGTYSGLNTISNTADIGNDGRTQGSGWDGIIDEFRISSSPRSSDWILTAYTNQNNATSFISVDGRETAPLIADAGTGSTVCGMDINLAATLSIGEGIWSLVSGAGNVTSWGSGAENPNTTVTVDTEGDYTFRWTESIGTCDDTDDVTFTIDDVTAPVITAPTPLTLTCNQGTDHSAAITAWLATASATDDCDGSVVVTDDLQWLHAELWSM